MLGYERASSKRKPLLRRGCTKRLAVRIRTGWPWLLVAFACAAVACWVLLAGLPLPGPGTCGVSPADGGRLTPARLLKEVSARRAGWLWGWGAAAGQVRPPHP